MSTNAVFFLCMLALAGAVKLPATYKRCKVSKELDLKPNECLREAMQDAISQLVVNGSKEMGVYDLDPLKIDRMVLEQGGGSSVAIKMVMSNQNAYGITSTKILSVSGKLSSPDKFEMIIHYKIDELKSKGLYNIKGKIMIFPIKGEGDYKSTMTKVIGKYTIRGERQTRNGKQYLKVVSTELDMVPAKAVIHLDNLFNGNKALSDNMNRFLNENWEPLYNDMKNTVMGPFSSVIESYAKRILERVQFKNLFIVEQ